MQRQSIINSTFRVCKQLIIRKACVPCKLCSAVWGPNADKIHFDIVLLDLLNNVFSELDCQLPAQCSSHQPPGQATIGVAHVCRDKAELTGKRVIPCCVPPQVPSRRPRSTEYQHRPSFVPKQARPASRIKFLLCQQKTANPVNNRPLRLAKPDTLNDPRQTVPAPC